MPPELRHFQRLAESPLYGLLPDENGNMPKAQRGGGAAAAGAAEGAAAVGTGEEEEEEEGLRLRDYQLEGVNWLVWNWFNSRASIL